MDKNEYINPMEREFVEISRDVIFNMQQWFATQLNAHLRDAVSRMGYYFPSDDEFVRFACKRMTKKESTDGTVSYYHIDDTPVLKVKQCKVEHSETKPFTYEQHIVYQFEHLAEIKNQTRSKFTLIAGDKEFELRLGQSPRGLRNKDKRPSEVIIESKERFNALGLARYIEYLQELSNALG